MGFGTEGERAGRETELALFRAIPNPMIFVDKEMKISFYSKGAEGLFQVSADRVLGRYLFELFDSHDFEKVYQTRKPMIGKRVDYFNFDVIALVNIIYVEEPDGVLGVFQDISMEAERSERALKRKMDTVEMAQKVIDRQMMVAQEIAGLLGETTAETKVTLTRLRDTIVEDDGHIF